MMDEFNRKVVGRSRCIKKISKKIIIIEKVINFETEEVINFSVSGGIKIIRKQKLIKNKV